MIVILIMFVIVCALYVLSTMCRSGHTGLRGLRGWAYAHRGLYGDGIPENSIEAFRRAKEAGYGVELDVHLLADGNLAVIHDALLKRITGVDTYIEDVTTEQLRDYRLEGTQETIPEFQQVLALFAGAVPLIVELKPQRNNYAHLCKSVCRMLDNYNGVYCLESFDPRCVYWLRKNRPDIIRGQLTENYLKRSKSKLPWYLNFLLTNLMLNFLTQPDFVAYRFDDRKNPSNFLTQKLWGAQSVAWTVNTPQEFHTAVEEDRIPIFEGFCP